LEFWAPCFNYARGILAGYSEAIDKLNEEEQEEAEFKRQKDGSIRVILIKCVSSTATSCDGHGVESSEFVVSGHWHFSSGFAHGYREV
jgi:hypothetical protein